MASGIDAGVRMLKRRYSKQPIVRYWGEPHEVCKRIIDACFDHKKGYFKVSAGHFSDFYVRDFGMCVEALLHLGYTKEVILTLGYALQKFYKANKVTTTITANGRCVNYFAYPADSMPFLIRSIRLISDFARGKNREVFERLIAEYQPFLEHQAEVYCSTVFDFQIGYVKEHVRFSSMKDHKFRKSSTYDNCMAGMLSLELDRLGWRNPLHDIPIGKHLVATRWNGYYFKQDAGAGNHVTGDANTFPFYCGVITNKDMLASCVKSIQQAGLDTPFPLKYSAKLVWTNKNMYAHLAPNYEGNTIWAHLGFCYLYVIEQYDTQLLKQYLELYYKNIKHWGNFIEVYQPDGKSPYKSLLYVADDSMLWASMYLHLAQKHNVH